MTKGEKTRGKSKGKRGKDEPNAAEKGEERRGEERRGEKHGVEWKRGGEPVVSGTARTPEGRFKRKLRRASNEFVSSVGGKSASQAAEGRTNLCETRSFHGGERDVRGRMLENR